MQPATPTAPETPRDSATVVLLRDAPAGMEVLLLRRHAQASNMAGIGRVYVSTQRLDSALTYFFNALRLNPLDELAGLSEQREERGAAASGDAEFDDIGASEVAAEVDVFGDEVGRLPQ